MDPFQLMGEGRKFLPLHLALTGTSTVGKTTLTEELAKRFCLLHHSAGWPNKRVLLNMGFPLEAVTRQGVLRNQPHPLLPINPATGVPYTPREYEIQVVQAGLGWRKLTRMNRMYLHHGFKCNVPLVFDGYRSVEQHRMLGELKAQLAVQGQVLWRIKIVSPQVDRPAHFTDHEDLLNNEAFEVTLWNDKRVPPVAMVEQLLTHARQRGVLASPFTG